MEITSFTVSPDRNTLDLVISDDASAVSSLKLWKSSTYKDYSLAIDLATFLTGSTTETLSFTPQDLDELYFDGVYFIEAEAPTDISSAIVADTTRYKECILDELLAMGVCDDCLKTGSIKLINSQTMLDGLEKAVELGFIDEIITIVIALDKYCSDSCRTCGEFTNLISTEYYTIQ